MKKLLLSALCAMLAITSNAQSFRNFNTDSSVYSNVKLQGYVNLGTNFLSAGAGPTFDATIGARIYDHLYAGVEVGFHTLFIPISVPIGDFYAKTTAYSLYVPIGVNLKGYFTKGHNFTPYINASLGGFIDCVASGGAGYCQVGMGFDIKRFAFGIGYSGLFGSASLVNMGYIKLGVRFGRR